jgi:hypothetical protein
MCETKNGDDPSYSHTPAWSLSLCNCSRDKKVFKESESRQTGDILNFQCTVYYIAYIPVLTTKTKPETMASTGESTEKLGLLCTADGNVKSPATLPKFFFKNPSNLTRGQIFIPRNENLCPHKDLYISIHSSCICNRQNLEATK